MPNKSSKWLYDQLSGLGYDLGKDYNEFDSLINNNDESRKWVYDTAVKEGYDVGKDYNEFTGFVTKVEEPKKTNVGAVTTKEKTGQEIMQSFLGKVTPIVDAARKRKVNIEEPSKRVNTNSNPVASTVSRPSSTSKKSSTLLDSIYEGIKNKVLDENAGNAIDPEGRRAAADSVSREGKTTQQYLKEVKEAVDTADFDAKSRANNVLQHGIGGDRMQRVMNDTERTNKYVDDVVESVKPQKPNIFINGELSTPENEIDAQLEIVAQQIQQRYQELSTEASNNPLIAGMDFMNVGSMVAGNSTSTGMTQSNYYDNDLVLQDLLSSQRRLMEAKKIKSAANDLHKSKGGLFGGGFGTGNNAVNLWRSVKDNYAKLLLGLNPASIDFGLKDATNDLVISNKIKRGEALTPSEQTALTSSALLSAVDQKYSSTLPGMYKATSGALESVPFMVQLSLSPVSGILKESSKKVGEYATKAIVKKLGVDLAKKSMKTALAKGVGLTGKVLTRSAGLTAESAITANTIQAQHLLANVFGRKVGDAYLGINEQGRLVGEGYEGGEDWFNSILHGEEEATTENLTEMMAETGVYQLLGKPVSFLVRNYVKGGEALVSKLSKLYNKVTFAETKGVLGNMMKSAHVGGLVEEMSEEEWGILINHLAGTDPNDQRSLLDKFTDWDEQLEIFNSLALSVGVMNATNVASVTAGNTYYNRMMNSASNKGKESFGEKEWHALTNALDAASDAGYDNVLKLFIQQSTDADQKMALLNYSRALWGLRGYNIGLSKQFEDANKSAHERARMMAEQQGYNEEDMLNKSDMTRAAQVLEERVRALTGMQEGTDINQYLDYFGGVDNLAITMKESGKYTDEDIKTLYAWDNARSRYAGIMNRVGDDIQTQIDNDNDKIARWTNENGLLVQGSIGVDVRMPNGESLPAGSRVYVINGGLQYDENGDVITGGTPTSLVILDPESNQKMMISSSILSEGYAMSADDFMLQNEAQVRSEMEQQANEDLGLSVTPGEKYQVKFDANDTPIDIVVTGIGEDGYVRYTMAGYVNELAISPEELQNAILAAQDVRVDEQISEEVQGVITPQEEVEQDVFAQDLRERATLLTRRPDVLDEIDDVLSDDNYEDIEDKFARINQIVESSGLDIEGKIAVQEYIDSLLNPTPAANAAGTVADEETVTEEEPVAEESSEDTEDTVASETDYPRDAEGYVDYEQITDAQTMANAKKEEFGDDALANLNNDITELEKKVAKLNGKADTKSLRELAKLNARLKLLTDARAILESENDESVDESKDTGALLGTEAHARREARKQSVIAEQQENFQKIVDKWDNARKVYGHEDVYTLPDGTKIHGRYVLVEEGSTTPSHDPHTFKPNSGFPVTKEGKTANSRDYENSKHSQDRVKEYAQDFNGNAVQDPIIVSSDGVVISGNNRSMSGELAAEKGTDGKYIETLHDKKNVLGLTDEQIDSFAHPRVVFVVNDDEAIDYTPATFDMFNKERGKSETSTERAVKLGKVVDDRTLRKLTNIVSRFDDLNALYQHATAGIDIIRELERVGVITSAEESKYLTDDKKLTSDGKRLIEETVIGSLFKTDEDVVRLLDGMPNVKKAIIKAAEGLLVNRTFPEGYSILSELCDAVRAVEAARKGGMSLEGFWKQGDLFGDDAKTLYNATVKALSENLDKNLAGIVSAYNERYDAEAKGPGGIFGKKSKEELLNSVLNVTAKASEQKTDKTQDDTEAKKPSVESEVYDTDTDGPKDGEYKKGDIVYYKNREVIVDSVNSDGTLDLVSKNALGIDVNMVGISQKDVHFPGSTDAVNFYYNTFKKEIEEQGMSVQQCENALEAFDKQLNELEEKNRGKVDISTADAESMSRIIGARKALIEKIEGKTETEKKPNTEKSVKKPSPEKPVKKAENPKVKHTLVTDERYEQLKSRMKELLKGQTNMGINPELLAIGTEMAVYHIEGGVRKFAAFCKVMVEELGDAVRPYLKAFYNGAISMPEVDIYADEFDDAQTVKNFDVMNFDNEDASVETESEQGDGDVVETDIEQGDDTSVETGRKEVKPKTKNQWIAEMAKLYHQMCDKYRVPQENILHDVHWFYPKITKGYTLDQFEPYYNAYKKKLDELVVEYPTEKQMTFLKRLCTTYLGSKIENPARLKAVESAELTKQAASYLIDLLKAEEDLINLQEFEYFDEEFKKVIELNGGKYEEKPLNATDNEKEDVSLQSDISAEVSEEDKKLRRLFSSRVAKKMRESLQTSEKPFKSIVQVRKFAEECGMTVDKEGRDDILLQELVEDGLTMVAKDVVNQQRATDFLDGTRSVFSQGMFDKVCTLYDMQPTISMRSSNKIKMQQYSTPLPMSYVADWFVFGEADRNARILEPTAGNGMLVFAIPSKQIDVNELDPVRKSVLEKQGYNKVTGEDATKANFEGEYDGIVTNPPFGSAEAKEYDGKMISGLDPQIALNALSSMKDAGKAAIIIGGEMKYADNGAIDYKKPFFTYLYDHYNVKAVIPMSGELYKKQGTKYPTIMILIDGRRSQEERRKSIIYPPVESLATPKVSTFEELYNKVNEVINSNNKTDGHEVLSSRELPELSNRDNKPRGISGSRDAFERTETGGERGLRDGDGLHGRSVLSERNELDERDNTRSGRDEHVGAENEIQRSDRRGERNDRELLSGVQPDDASDGVGQGLLKKEEKRELNQEKLPYRQHNSAFSLESVAPAHMVEAMDAVLKRIEEEEGDIEHFLTKELGYGSVKELHDALAGEQIDAVAMAVYQMKQGQAMIIGDQTGVGKGRQMAALIRYANKQGKKPIFLTLNADLFSDIYRDLVDVGSGDLRPLFINDDSDKRKSEMTDEDGRVVYRTQSAAVKKKIFASGKIPDDVDFVVATYSQFNRGDAISREEGNARAKEGGARGKKAQPLSGPTPKATYLRAIVKDNYLFMDESHNAAGDGNTGDFFQSILPSAKAVTFASATFAKRPDTMPLYAIRTAMSKANVAASDLITIIKRGGATLQEIMSRALTEAGQLVRRERDMSDVVTDWITVDDPETAKFARENYDKTIEVFNDIIDFQKNYILPTIKEEAAALASVASSASAKKGKVKMGIDNVPFANRTYNYTKQLLLAIKVDAIVNHVTAEIEAGRKPVIALESTMETEYKDLVEGEIFDEPTFAVKLIEGLNDCMEYRIKDPDGNGISNAYKPEDLGKEGAAKYYEIVEKIKEATKDVFISPLDAIERKLTEKKISFGELTGRNKCLVLDESGREVVTKRSDTNKKDLARRFNNGEIDCVILNKSASTGISLQSSKNFKDQRQRTMIIAQPLSDINDYMQMIGRTDRTGQVYRGYYINLGLPVPAESRFLMMLSTKLKSLNANTSGAQESNSSKVEAPDMLNKYGSKVVVEYLKENPDIYEKMGNDVFSVGGEGSKKKLKSSEISDYKPSLDDEDIRRATGRAALLTTEEQDTFYNEITQRYKDLIKYLDDTGTNDLHITTLPLRAKTISKKISSKGSDSNGSNQFAKDAYVEKVEIDILNMPMSSSEIQKNINHINGDVGGDARQRDLRRLIAEDKANKLKAEDERYEKARAKAKESLQKIADKINAREKQSAEDKAKEIAEKEEETWSNLEAKHEENIRGIESKSKFFDARVCNLNTGRTYLVPDCLDRDLHYHLSPAIFCGFRYKEGTTITPSKVKAVFAVLDGRRGIELTLSQVEELRRITKATEDNWDTARMTDLTNWDRIIPKEARTEAYIMTGNILQAASDIMNEDGSFPGQLISYTDLDGNIHDGILMPSYWEPNQLKNAGVPISARLEQIRNGDFVNSSDGKVMFRPYSSYKVILSVPKSKKEGGKYFQNEELLNIVGGFRQRNGAFHADVNKSDLPNVLDILSKLGVRVEDNSEETIDAPFRKGAENNPRNSEWTRMTGEAAPIDQEIKRFAREMSKELNTQIDVLMSEEDVDAAIIPENDKRIMKREGKGYYDIKTGKVYLYTLGHETLDDAVATILHEVVGHKGLRQMFGKEKFDSAMKALYTQLPSDVQDQINNFAEEYYKGDILQAIDEYLAQKAESDETPTWWDKVKAAFKNLLRSIGVNVTLTDNDIKYLLWQSKNILEKGDLFGYAEQTKMRRKWGIGKSTVDKKFYDSVSGRFKTSGWLFEHFPDWNKTPNSTQITTTRATYVKIGEWLLENYGDQAKRMSILDASSGLGYGTAALREEGFNIDDVEPFQTPKRLAGLEQRVDKKTGITYKSEPATYKELRYADVPDNSYDFIISNAVLNVVPDDWREDILRDMGKKVRPGGTIYINVVGAKYTEGLKNAVHLDPQEALAVNAKGNSYQRGYSPSQLRDYVHEILGEDWIVRNSPIGMSAIFVTKPENTGRFKTKEDPMNSERKTDEFVTDYKDVGEPFKNYSGTKIGRDNGRLKDPIIGKRVGNELYVHKDYVTNDVRKIMESGEKFLPDGFKYNCVVTSKAKPGWIRYDEAPDFDTAREPITGSYVWVNPSTGETKEGRSPYFWHHKWQWVGNDYKGFDVKQSYEWSRTFAPRVLHNPEGANRDKWHAQLEEAGLPAEGYPVNINYGRFSISGARYGFKGTDLQKEWHEIMNSWATQAVTVMFDNMHPLKKFQDLIAKSVAGKKEVADYENAYQAFMSLGGINNEQISEFGRRFVEPLNHALLGIIGNHKIKKDGSDWDWKNDPVLRRLTNYVISKHGIERNRDMAVRKELKQVACEEYKAEKDAIDEKYQMLISDADDRGDADEIKRLNKSWKSEIRGLKTVAERFEESLNDFYTEIETIRVKGGKWRKQQEEMDDVARSLGADIDKEFSGLSSIYDRANGDIRQQAYDEVESYEKDKDTEKMWDALQAMSAFMLVKQNEGGLTTQDYVDTMSKRWEFYVPLRGFDKTMAEDVYEYKDEGKGMGDPLKKAKGRTSLSNNPFAEMISLGTRSIAYSNKNSALVKFYNLIRKHPSSLAKIVNHWEELNMNDEWEVVEPQLHDTDNPEEIVRILEDFEAKMKSLEEIGVARKARDGKASLPYSNIYKRNVDKHEIWLRVGGKRVSIFVAGDPDVIMALKGELRPSDSGSALKSINRWRAGLLTSYNASFATRNLARDSEYGAISTFVNYAKFGKPNGVFSKYLYHRGGLFVGSLVQAARIGKMLRDYRNGKKPTTGQGYVFNEFMRYGGATGWTLTKDPEEARKTIENAFKELRRSGKNPLTWPKKTFEALKGLVELITNSSELVNRFAIYQAVREKGGISGGPASISRAIAAAKDVTLNFERVGAGKSFIGSKDRRYGIKAIAGLTSFGQNFLMFFNANMQGKYQLYNLFKKNPAKATCAFTIPAILHGSALVWINNVVMPMIYAALGMGGDGDDENYYDLPDYIRQNNLCLRKPGGGWFMLPESPEVTPIVRLADKIGMATAGERPMEAGDIAEPMNFILPNAIDYERVVNVFGDNGGKRLAQNLASSTVFGPAVDLLVNMKFSGKSIYQENSKKPSYLNGKRSTSKLFNKFAKFMNEASGGNELINGEWWGGYINPAVTQHFIEGYLGGYGSTAIGIADVVNSYFGTEEEDTKSRGMSWEKAPFVSGFFKSGTGDAINDRVEMQYYNLEQFYKEQRRLDKAIMKMYKEGKDYNEIMSMEEKLKKDDDFKIYQELKNSTLIEYMGKLEKSTDDDSVIIPMKRDILKAYREIKTDINK